MFFIAFALHVFMQAFYLVFPVSEYMLREICKFLNIQKGTDDAIAIHLPRFV